MDYGKLLKVFEESFGRLGQVLVYLFIFLVFINWFISTRVQEETDKKLLEFVREEEEKDRQETRNRLFSERSRNSYRQVTGKNPDW